MAAARNKESGFLCSLLEKKFGALNSEILELINNADADFLDRIGEALLTSSTLKEVITKARGIKHRLISSSDIELQIGSSIYD